MLDRTSLTKLPSSTVSGNSSADPLIWSRVKYGPVYISIMLPTISYRWCLEVLRSYLVSLLFSPLNSTTTKCIWNVSTIFSSLLVLPIIVIIPRIGSRCCFGSLFHYVECAVPVLPAPPRWLGLYQRYGRLLRWPECWQTWAPRSLIRFLSDPRPGCHYQLDSDPDGTDIIYTVSYSADWISNSVVLYQTCKSETPPHLSLSPLQINWINQSGFQSSLTCFRPNKKMNSSYIDFDASRTSSSHPIYLMSTKFEQYSPFSRVKPTKLPLKSVSRTLPWMNSLRSWKPRYCFTITSNSTRLPIEIASILPVSVRSKIPLVKPPRLA